MILSIDMKRYLIVWFLSFNCLFVFSQDLKITEINVVEGLDMSVPDAVKLNIKASFQDTSKIDKTQKYFFINKAFYYNFITRPLVAAKVKSKNKYDVNSTNIKLALGNYSYKYGDVSYNSKYKKSFSYGLRLTSTANKYKTTIPAEYDVSNKDQSLSLFTRSVLSKSIIGSSFNYDNIVAQHDFSNANGSDNKNTFTYSQLACFISSRSSENQRTSHKTTFSFSDFNSQTENHIVLSSDISSTINSTPYNLFVEFNNYLNYNNPNDVMHVLQREKLDVKIIDITPNFHVNKFGFDIDFGFNLGIENNNSENTADIFPLLNIRKELVKNVLNISFGIDRYDDRNTLASLSRENPYIHSLGLNSSVNEIIDSSHTLETTDIYELYFNLDNKLSDDEFLSFYIAYGKVSKLHYFDLTHYMDYNRFSVDYIDVWQLKINSNYNRKLNNLLSLNLDVDYFYWNKVVPHKADLHASLSFPVSVRDKIECTPSFEYIGKRKATQMTGLFIESPERETIELDEQFLLNFSVNYNYSKKFGFYFNLNNILNSQKELWLGYQQLGMNLNFGLNFLF